MRRNLINNYRFLDFPQETSIEIKQGDFTPITVKLDSTETVSYTHLTLPTTPYV